MNDFFIQGYNWYFSLIRLGSEIVNMFFLNTRDRELDPRSSKTKYFKKWHVLHFSYSYSNY